MAKKKIKRDLYELYEASVQDSVEDARFLTELSKKESGKAALKLREDFCGTHWLCYEWVKLSPKHTALGIDLELGAISWGKAKRSDPKLRSRIQNRIQDVRKPTIEKFDLIAALNFSYFIFRERAQLLKYFQAARKSLRPGGILALDHFGGPGIYDPELTPSKCKTADKKRFVVEWEEKNFDPATHEVECAIHFRFPGEKRIKNAFVYPWRFWTLPELRDLLLEAGFREVACYFEAEDGRFRRDFKNACDFEQWIAYLAAKA